MNRSRITNHITFNEIIPQNSPAFVRVPWFIAKRLISADGAFFVISQNEDAVIGFVLKPAIYGSLLLKDGKRPK